MNFFQSSSFPSSFPSLRVEHTGANAVEELANGLLRIPNLKDCVVVCIGTDRSTGDSLGPMIGTFLSEMSLPISVYGTLDDPIHAVNLEQRLREIHTKHPNQTIIGIDACLGKLKSVGHVLLEKGPVRPGAGVDKELPPVGDYHIVGIVNVSGFMEFFVLQNTKLSIVMKMAKMSAKAFECAFEKLEDALTQDAFDSIPFYARPMA